MKKAVLSILICLLFTFSFGAAVCAEEDGAVISAQEDKYVPLYTTSPDSSLREHSTDISGNSNYGLFYTQTTVLALIAGYLILVKVRRKQMN